MLVLLVWWIVAPTLFDDGWWAQLRTLGDGTEASLYYDSFGLSLPLGFGLAWLGHWITDSTDDLVFMRLPSLVALLAAWVLCRWCLHRVTRTTPTSAVRWTLAAAFLVGAVAWGMTLRPEPFVSLLMLTSLAAMISFTISPRLAPLAVAVPVLALAVTTHPVGIVAGAPVLAGVPQLIRWLRTDGARLWTACTALILTGLALTIVLFALDADLATRLADGRVLRARATHDEAWWREWTRYAQFDGNGGGTAVRTLSLALLVLSPAAFAARSRLARTGVLSLPAQSVLIALALLAFVPSKWPWHFGALAAVGAVAMAAEVERLMRESSLVQRSTRPVAGLVAIAVAALVAWTADGRWGPLDVQRATWSPVFNVAVVGLGLAFVMTVIAVSRMRPARQRRERSSATSLVSWAVPVVSSAVILTTIGILVVDATITSWSPARQNLEALAGRSSCGVASQLRGADELGDELSDSAMPTLLAAPIALYFPCATMPAIENGLVEIPHLVAVEPAVIAGVWPLDVEDSPFAAVSDLYQVSIAARGPGHIDLYSVQSVVEGFALLPAVLQSDAGSVAET